MSDEFSARYGPWAIVLGAGQGIGRAFADEAGRRGLRLLLVDVREDLLGRAQAELAAVAPEVRSAVIDLARADLAEALREATAGIEVGLAVYSAAVSNAGPFLDDPLERHLAAVAVNCAGVTAASHVLAGPMRDRGRGGLVLISSLAGFQGTGWVAGYSATKAFDLVLAEALWWELAPEGVDVLALVPGSTDTEGFRSSGPPGADPASLQSPDEVAREALDALGRQSLLVPGEGNRTLREALAKLPREQLVTLMSEQTRKLYAKRS